jgi:hypothetical protein
MNEIFDLIGRHAILAGVLFVTTLATSFAVALTVLVRLPADCLCASRAEDAWHTNGTVRSWGSRISRNFLGGMLVAVGIVLSLPSIPGQGLVTVVAGILLLDFPGKRRLLRFLFGRPRVVSSINRLRARFGNPPLIVD